MKNSRPFSQSAEKYHFYHSKAWVKLSKLFLSSKHFICERCGKPAVIAHHKIYLNARNYSNPAISLNPENLEALCLHCHNREHFGNVGRAIADGLVFTKDGDIVRE